jgi:hypothetical protein
MPANTTTTALHPTASPNNADYVSQPCGLFYWVSLSATLEPLLGTMRAKNNNRYDVGGTPCNEARLTNYQMKPPAGHTQCFFPSGFRYFYLVSQITGQIIPNSMIQVSGQKKPKLMCTGTNHYLEYINFVPQPQVNN